MMQMNGGPLRLRGHIDSLPRGAESVIGHARSQRSPPGGPLVGDWFAAGGVTVRKRARHLVLDPVEKDLRGRLFRCLMQ